MARPWRIEYENAVYQVAPQGNNREEIFLDDGGRLAFLGFWGRAEERRRAKRLQAMLAPALCKCPIRPS